MDLIYTNAQRQDQGVLQEYELDLAYGADENDFACTVARSAHCCAAGSLLYMEDTEYGGIVDKLTSDTAAENVTYEGRTWHGLLNSKVLQPDDGADYLVLSGEANALLAALLERVGLTELFAASAADSGLVVTDYRMERYCLCYDGIRKMLASVGGKLCLAFRAGRVQLEAQPIRDYTRDEAFDSDLLAFQAAKAYHPVNHLICLGSGELAQRTVLHLYADADGSISDTQSLTGLAEVTAVYDYSAAQDAAELERGGRERLQELRRTDTLSIRFDSTDTVYDIGDRVGAADQVTGLTVSAVISKKIVTVRSGAIAIDYQVED